MHEGTILRIISSQAMLDVIKKGILRELESVRFSNGINWYKTHEDSQKTGGSHTSLLDIDGNQTDLHNSQILRYAIYPQPDGDLSCKSLKRATLPPLLS